MNVKQQLKKRRIFDKKGKVKGFVGKLKFKANPTIPGYSGTEDTLGGDKHNVNVTAKSRDELVLAKTQKERQKLINKLESEKTMREMEKQCV